MFKETHSSWKFEPKDENEISNCLTAQYAKMAITATYVKVKSNNSKGYEVAEIGDTIRLAHPNSETSRGRISKEVSHTIDCSGQEGIFIGDYRYDEGFRFRQNGNSPTITTSAPIYLKQNFKIRRLTPRECFRLMDFPDTFDFSVVSESQAYKQAGNSIVVNVLYKILKNLNL